MNETQLLEWFRQHLYSSFGVRKEIITPSADLGADLGLDSIDQMNLMCHIEEEFRLDDLSLVLADDVRILTIGDAIQTLLAELNSGRSSSGDSSTA